jgi:hypothetical protein
VTRFAIDPATLVELARSNPKIGANHQLVAPNSIRSSALDILLIQVRNGELSDSDALALHERMTELKIRLLGDRVSRRTAWRIARDHDWNTLELAEYIAVTTLQADALVATNPELAALATDLVPLATLADVLQR